MSTNNKKGKKSTDDSPAKKKPIENEDEKTTLPTSTTSNISNVNAIPIISNHHVIANVDNDREFRTSVAQKTTFRPSLQPQLMSVSTSSSLKPRTSSFGSYYAKKLIQTAKVAKELKAQSAMIANKPKTGVKKVGIVGAGFGGLYAGLILQSLGIDFEIFESSDRVGGRIKTWYSKFYDPANKETCGLYGEVGGMRVPQYALDMLPVKQLSLAVNAALQANNLPDPIVYWRNFHYASSDARLRYNNMKAPLPVDPASKSDLGFSESNGGQIPDAWFKSFDIVVNDKTVSFRPIDKILDQINDSFISALDDSFETGFQKLMQFDRYSMWSYLTIVFTLGDLGPYYRPELGGRADILSHAVAVYLETINVGSNMYLVGIVEMVIAVYDWNGSKNPYDKNDKTKDDIVMITVDGGMQRFADACSYVVNLNKGVSVEQGAKALEQVGMVKDPKTGKYQYTNDILPDDQERPIPYKNNKPRPQVERIHLQHQVTSVYRAEANDKVDKNDKVDHSNQIKVSILNNTPTAQATGVQKEFKFYDAVITTLPNGNYLNGQSSEPFFKEITSKKSQALRRTNYMSAFKAFITFKKQFWITENRQYGGVGASDVPGRQIVYPSYGYYSSQGVLQIYCWADDAKKLGALPDKQSQIAECVKMIFHLYPEVKISDAYDGYNPNTSEAWFWDENAGGGAFTLYGPGQFGKAFPHLMEPEYEDRLYFAGEAVSVHNGWVAGALDSAYSSVTQMISNLYEEKEAQRLLTQIKATWGDRDVPDVAPPEDYGVLKYRYQYSEFDRKSDSQAGTKPSIYSEKYKFEGDVPAFIYDYTPVPSEMKKTREDDKVLDMLNRLWNRNEELKKTAFPLPPSLNQSAVALLEHTYYGNNFQAIPKPEFWLKDDDEFARQQLGGFMPNVLEASTFNPTTLPKILGFTPTDSNLINNLTQNTKFVANFRKYLSACTVVPKGFYLAKPVIFFSVDAKQRLMPIAIQLEDKGEIFTPTMPNAENAWLLAKMLTNCAGQTLHDVGFHQLYTHQVASLVSIALFSSEVFKDQNHNVFKLLKPHVVKALEFQQNVVYNYDFNPNNKSFPDTRDPTQSPGVYNFGFVYDLIFSCGRIGNYQLQDKMWFNDGNFRFLDLAINKDAYNRGVLNTSFSYPYLHDSLLWYKAISEFVNEFVHIEYQGKDALVANDQQLQRFFDKLIPAFNWTQHNTQNQCQRFPTSVKTCQALTEVLTMFIWQFSVQHTVVNDGAYNQAAFVPNASTLMYAPPQGKSSSQWSVSDVLNCLPNAEPIKELGGMNFMEVQINASVTGQGPYQETFTGRGIISLPAVSWLQSTYNFTGPELINNVNKFYKQIVVIDDKIRERQARDTKAFLDTHPESTGKIPETVLFSLLLPTNVMTAILT